MGRIAASKIIAEFEPFERRGLLLYTQDNARRRTLRKWSVAGKLVSPYPGLFAQPTFWSPLDRTEQEICKLKTLAEMHPDWTFCSFSAAVLQGLSVSYSLLGQVHVIRPTRRHGGDTKQLRSHTFRDAPTMIEASGIRATSIPYTVAECLLDAPFRCGLALADSALHLGLISPEMLKVYVQTIGHDRRGVGRARKVADLADGRAESGGESLARAAMLELGFSAPDLQVRFRDPVDPSRHFRVDFLWMLGNGKRVVGEFDGKSKYHVEHMTGGATSETIFESERQRESRLTLLGMPVVRFEASDLRKPALFARKLRAAGIPQDEDRAFRTDPRDLM